MRKFILLFCVLLIPCPSRAADGIDFYAKEGLRYGTVNLLVQNRSGEDFEFASYEAAEQGGEVFRGGFAMGKNVSDAAGLIEGLHAGARYDISVTLHGDARVLKLPEVRGVRAQPFAISSMDGKSFTIETADQLKNIRRLQMYDGGLDFTLASDIGPVGFMSPIGDERRPFRNSFDGGGHTISGLRVSDKNCAGLFGKLESASVTGLVLDGVYSSAGIYAGSLAGLAVSSLIENVTVRDAVAETSGGFENASAGGLVGEARGSMLSENFNHDLRITNCAADAEVSSLNGHAGGFAGRVSYALVENGAASGNVTTTNGPAGGFAGSVSDRSRIIGGKAASLVESRAGSAGGFLGEISGRSCAEFSIASGSVASNGAAGGFAGTVSDAGAPNTLTECFSFAPWVRGGDARATHRFAGRLLHNGVNNCYAGLGVMVAVNGELTPVIPGAYSADGADVSLAEFENDYKKLARWNYLK